MDATAARGHANAAIVRDRSLPEVADVMEIADVAP